MPKAAVCVFSFLLLVQLKVQCQNADGSFTVINKIRFPFSVNFGPFMGLIVAFDIKLVPSDLSVDMVWSVEANYLLPQNQSEFTFPPVIPADSSRSSLFDRGVLYKIIETKLQSFSKSYNGKHCMLRIICEMALHTTKDIDILGDLLHIVLSPSSSINTNLSLTYSSAESYGSKNKHCKKYAKKCSVNFLNYISVFGNLLDDTFLG